VSYPIFVGRSRSIKAVLYAKEHNVPILLAAQKDAHASEVSSSDMYDVGIMARVIEVMRLPDGTLKTVIEGRKRVRITRFIFSEDFARVHAEEIEEMGTSNPRLEGLITAVVSAFVRERLSTIAEALNNPKHFLC
jgi:ATP-dependent Lon protease